MGKNDWWILPAIVTAGGVYLLLKSGIIDSIINRRYNNYEPDDFEEVSKLTTLEAQKAIKKAEASDNLFETLSKELSDEEEVDKKLKSLLER